AADSFMALGRLGEAIAHYRLALEHTSKEGALLIATPHYGLAVALDRDGQPERSAEEMRLALVRDPELAELEDRGGVFVRAGDKHYYVALGEIARGRLSEAAAALRRFLASGPPPRYAARAGARLKEVEARLAAPPR